MSFFLITLSVGSNKTSTIQSLKVLIQKNFYESQETVILHLKKKLNLCRKSSQKLRALSWISQYLSPKKKRILFKTFVTFQLNDCPLVWMCHSCTFNRTNNIHHRALRILYKDKKLLQKDKSVSVHMKNLQYLATEIFKVKNRLSPIIMREVFHFQEKDSYNLRKDIHLASRNMHAAHFGTDTITSSGPNLWKLISDKTCLNIISFQSEG